MEHDERRRLVLSRRSVAGFGVAAVLVVALTAAMVPLRSHLSVATSGLVLVVPVVASVAIGGFAAGMVATVLGFLAFDFVFVPPFYTLDVSAGEDWTALGVYVVVMVVVARVVSRANAARAEAQRRADEVRRLFDLSEVLVRESSPPELLDTITGTVLAAFALESAALLVPSGDHLEPAPDAIGDRRPPHRP